MNAGPPNEMRQARLQGHGWQGTVLDNIANAARQGSGLNPLYYEAFSAVSLFRADAVGWNFEHIFNGAAGDAERSMFTPRKDPCFLRSQGDTSATLHWPARDSSWGAEAELTYQIIDPHAIDMRFAVAFEREVWPLDYVAMMWASYMHCTRERRIHFYGRDGEREGWISFGDDIEGGFETGTVRCDGVEPLRYQDGAETLNVVEHPDKTFILPFYVGLVAGHGDVADEEGTMAYTVMFDQAESIRFAMWNFFTDGGGHPDPHSPAWDWQFVVRSPERNRAYGYRCRISYQPFRGYDAVLDEYQAWRGQLPP